MRIALVPLVPLAPLAAAAVASPAWAIDYLSSSEAERLLFPAADAFETVNLQLEEAQFREVARRAGLPARSAQWGLRIARQGGAAIGFVVVDNVIGKFERITYAVAVGIDGAIRQIEILSYRESHGGEIRLPAWRRQFVGKTTEAPLRVGDDIANISGATLSCTHVTDGVRRIAAVLAVAREAGRLP